MMDAARWLGKPVSTKMDEFPENFRTAFAPPPPPLFRKNSLRFFPQTGCAGTKFAMKFFRSEMTPPFFEVFLEIHDKKSCFKCKKIAMKFFRSEMTPPPFGNFPEIHSNPGRQASLTRQQLRPGEVSKWEKFCRQIDRHTCLPCTWPEYLPRSFRRNSWSWDLGTMWTPICYFAPVCAGPRIMLLLFGTKVRYIHTRAKVGIGEQVNIDDQKQQKSVLTFLPFHEPDWTL